MAHRLIGRRRSRPKTWRRALKHVLRGQGTPCSRNASRHDPRGRQLNVELANATVAPKRDRQFTNNRATRDDDQKGGQDNDRGAQARPHCQPKTVRAEGDERAPITADRAHRLPTPERMPRGGQPRPEKPCNILSPQPQASASTGPDAVRGLDDGGHKKKTSHTQSRATGPTNCPPGAWSATLARVGRRTTRPRKPRPSNKWKSIQMLKPAIVQISG